MHRGYVKLWRKVADNDLWKSEKFTRGQAWIDLVMLANHKDGHVRIRGIKIEIKRGQLAYSEISLASRWKWSRGKVRRFLSELSKNSVQQIVQQKNNLTTLITILNYNEYQGAVQQTGQQTVQQTDTKRYTNKNVNNEKNKKNAIFDQNDFDLFYSKYPNKKGKQAALAKWKTLLKKGSLPSVDILLNSIQAQIDWRKEPGDEFKENWKHPSTWLHQGCWEDEVNTESKTIFVEDE